MLRVGIILNFNKNSWRGGYEYIKNLIKCLSLLKNKKIKFVIIIGKNTNINHLKDLNCANFLRTKLVNQSFINRVFHKVLLFIFGKNIFLDNYLISKKIKILSHFYYTGHNSKIKSIYWIPDFQEINTNYLSIKQKMLRYINLNLCTKNSTKILLSSKTVQNDLGKLNTIGYKKSKVIKPHFFIDKNSKFLSIKELKKKYNFEKNYFFLPNQYWVHKNHILILKTLKEIKHEYKKEILVLSTGIFYDYRHPRHNRFIKEYIYKNNLEINYKILGVVPFKDLVSLMYNSIGVLNPSKSEGWSSTVEQAKSMGKMILLSNLKVHREQNPMRSFYFNPNSTNKLKKKMIKLDNEFNLTNERKLIKKKMKNNILNAKKFANNYQDMILETL